MVQNQQISKFLLLIFLVSCGQQPMPWERRKRNDIETKPSLHLQFMKERKKLESLVLPTGWPSHKGCDQSFWAGLACWVGIPVQMTLAEYIERGRIERRPYHSCLDDLDNDGNPDSRSSVSPEMMGGALLCSIRQNDYKFVERIFNYAKDHDWWIGDPHSQPGEVWLEAKPNWKRILIRTYEKLLNIDSGEFYFPPAYKKVSKDFERHVQNIAIMTEGIIEGSVTENMRQMVNVNRKSDKKDCFFKSMAAIWSDYPKEDAEDCYIRNHPYYPSYVRGDNVEALRLINRLVGMSLLCPECVTFER